jgi:hypothetical protein
LARSLVHLLHPWRHLGYLHRPRMCLLHNDLQYKELQDIRLPRVLHRQVLLPAQWLALPPVLLPVQPLALIHADLDVALALL